MADDKKKPGLALVIEAGKKAANGEETEPGSDDEEAGESFDATASEMFDAIKNDDVEGFKQALRAAIKTC